MDHEQDIIAQAKTLAEQGLHQEAFGLMQSARIETPSERYYGQLAILANELGDQQAERKYLKQVIEMSPACDPAHSSLGLAFEREGMFEEAEESFCAAVSLKPAAPTLILLGVVQMRQGKLATAAETFVRALKIEPSNEEALFNLSIALRFHNLAESHRCLLRAVEIDSSTGAYHRELGLSHALMGNQRQAFLSLDEALALDPDDVWAHIYSACLHFSSEREHAIRHIDNAEALGPDLPAVKWLRSISVRDVDGKASLVHLQQAIEAEDGHFDLFRLETGLVQCFAGDWENGMDVLCDVLSAIVPEQQVLVVLYVLTRSLKSPTAG